MTELLLKITKAIESSPFKIIRGECKLLHLMPSEWNRCLLEPDFFTGYSPEYRTISFSFNNQLGDLVVEKQHLEISEVDKNGILFVDLEIKDDDLSLSIHIQCESKLPGFGTFLAYLPNIVAGMV